MLRSVPEHPKFTKLASLLDKPKYAIAGILEMTWNFTSRFSPQGNIGRFSDAEIESWVGWDGPRGKLINALLECRWIDKSNKHRLLVHDWSEHADHTTKIYLKRKGLNLFETCANNVHTSANNVHTCSDNIAPLFGKPEPVPEPEPDKEKQAKEKSPSEHPDPSHPPRPRKRGSRGQAALEIPDLPESLNTPNFREHFGQFIEYRRNSKHPLTPQALKIAIKRCAEIGPEAACSKIEETILHGWRAWFSPKYHTQSNSHLRPEERPEPAKGAKICAKCGSTDEVSIVARKTFGRQAAPKELVGKLLCYDCRENVCPPESKQPCQLNP
jgi:hypothetical protein